MDYKSARLIGASGKLQKNKGVMIVGLAPNVTLKFKGLSGGNWVDSSAVISGTQTKLVTIVPIQVYEVTISAGTVFELN